MSSARSSSDALAGTVSSEVQIVNVWAENLQQELSNIIDLVDTYPYIAMDTEFPGVVVRPLKSYPDLPTHNYQTLKCNVDILKLIQLGLCLTNERGELPPEQRVWQFNFRFNLMEDFFAPDSIELLMQAGIDFSRHSRDGIDPVEFAELLMTSGIVLNPDTYWISFHAGYDYGYFLQMLTCMPLPSDSRDFFELLSWYFPCIFDLKEMIRQLSPPSPSDTTAATAAASTTESDSSCAPSKTKPSAARDGDGGDAADKQEEVSSDKETAQLEQAEHQNANRNSLSPSEGKASPGGTSASDNTAAAVAAAGSAEDGYHSRLPYSPGVSVELENGKTSLHHHQGLQAIADALGLKRRGVQHQAGSDSLLTAQVFFLLRQKLFKEQEQVNRLSNAIYGLESFPLQSGSRRYH